jgi:hypothetical protein
MTEVLIPIDAPFSVHRELLKGCSFFIGLVGVASGLSGLGLVLTRKPEGPATLIFSACVWLVLCALFAFNKRRDQARVARPAGHIRLTPTELSVPSLDGGVDTLRWMDLRQVRMTRDTDASIFYEFFSDTESPEIVLRRDRVRDVEALERELQSRGATLERTFEWERPTSTPAIPSAGHPPEGEKFRVSLPPTGWRVARGCGGLILILAIAFGLALGNPEIALKFFEADFSIVILTAALILGIFLATRSSHVWIIAANDGLHFKLPGMPAFLPWSEIRDYTFTSTGGRHPRTTLILWTPSGSWKLAGVRINNESKLESLIRGRSARRPQAFYEIRRPELFR